MLCKRLIIAGCFIFAAITARGQIVTECPRNIGFESGSLTSWQCQTGEISGTGRNFEDLPRPARITMFSTGPSGERHRLIPRGTGIDPYGGFSLDAPNGSNYVIQLGNNNNGREAESISYIVNVPANTDEYSIIFNYAVVLENPDHEQDEQPKFTAKVIDLATGTSTECGSFEFTAPGAGGGIPGFEPSPLNDSVLYKPWAPVMVNLSNYKGRTIKLEFTTNDCSRGRHFGYAYLDFDENCSIPIIGNIVCPESAQLTLKVIPGLAEYNWFDAETYRSLGTGPELTLSPAPPSGTRIGVELTPYEGLGCKQTLYTTITSMYMNINDPPERCVSVDITSTSVTVGNSSDLTYTYWRDSDANVPLVQPNRITADGTYFIKGTSSSGCSMILPVLVTLTKLQPIVINQPAAVTFPAAVDITNTFTKDPEVTYSYWTDSQASKQLSDPEAIRRPGIYYVKGANNQGCFNIAQVTVDIIMPDFFIPNTFTPNGDGINDVFTIITSSAFSIKSFRIFNRWGDIVYQTADITKYWNGLKENSDVPAGVYYWLLEGDENLEYFKKSGYVMVLR